MTATMKKQLCVILAIVSLVAIVLGLAPSNAFAEAFAQDDYSKYFSGGSGSASDPYLIADDEQLENIKYTYDYSEGSLGTYKSFKLLNNITIKHDWSPLPKGFYGVLDGNGKSISNLRVTLGSGLDCGLFEYNEGEIKNINFNSPTLIIKQQTETINYGVVAGHNSGTISNCNVSNCNITTSVTNVNIGFIAGRSDHGLISNCTVYGTCAIYMNIYNANVGGMVGAAYNAGVQYCINYARLTGSGNTGGMVGYSYGAMFGNCQNEGTITYLRDTTANQNGCAAGIIGKAERDTDLIRCSNVGKIIYGSEKKVGDNSIHPCMAQIVGWAVSATLEACTVGDPSPVNYDNLYRGLFINQANYCSEGAVGRTGA